MASIQRRGKYWRAQVRKRGWEHQSRTFDTKSQALAWATHLESEMDRGVFVSRAESERTSLSEALTRYAKEVSPAKKPSTRDAEIGRINRWLRDPLASRSLANLRSQDLAMWRDSRLVEGASPNTIRLDLAVLSHLFTVARKEWGMEGLTNPVASIRKPSLAGTERSRRLNGDEEERLLDAAKHYGLEIELIIIWAIETGMRRGEIVRTALSDLNLEKSILHVKNSKNADSRFVPLTPKAITAIETLMDIDPKGVLVSYSASGVSQAFAKVCRAADISDLKFHDLRHEATSRLFEKGLDTMEVASITGHRTLQMLRRYTHLRAEKLVRKIR